MGLCLNHKTYKASFRITCATYAALLRTIKVLSDGKRVHGHIVEKGLEQNVYLRNLLLQMYGNCGALWDARAVFATVHQRDQFSWNFMIAMSARHGQCNDALQDFHQMQIEGVPPNAFVFASILSACTNHPARAEGNRVHARILCSGFQSDVVVSNALVNMYAKCGKIGDARVIFDRLTERSTSTWTSIISAYVQHELGKDALTFYNQMQQEGVSPNRVTFVSIVSACGCSIDLKHMHARVASGEFARDVVIENALVNMYGKCGSLEDAKSAFDNTLERNVFSWTAMIGAYVQHGKGKGALQLFYEMHREGEIPDGITFVATLSACTTVGAIREGRQMHVCIVDRRLESDVLVGTALISMYAKCGSVEDAVRVFEKMHERNTQSWNAMIAAYAQHGHVKSAVQLFHEMQQKGESPDKATFVCVLSACSHVGLVDEGCQIFASMIQDHGIIPSADHCNCVVDLLARAGRLKEAEDLIKNMPCQPTLVSWMTLLGACKNQADVEQGEYAAKRVFESFDPESTAPYILLSNIYAAVGRDDDAEKVVTTMRDKYLKKPRTCHIIEV